MVNIDLSMVKGVIQLIDVVAKRGAFEGNELSQVGQLRDDLIEAARPELEAEAEAEKAKNADNAAAPSDDMEL